MNETPTRTIVDAHGKPARATDTTCPKCGAGDDKRVAANGFGIRRPACGQCGHVWEDEVYVEKERD